MSEYNPKSPDAFKQETLPEPQPLPSNIVPIPGGSIVDAGDLSSPNFREGSAGWRVRSTGDAEFNDATIRGTIVIGGQYVTVKVGDSIQDALDRVNASGGGTVVLENGVHYVSNDIILYGSTTLKGQNSESAIIDFGGGSYTIKAIGTGAYTTGTVTVANNATSVTGNGTAWLANVSAGQYIMLSGLWYPITGVTGDGTLSIAVPFSDVGLTTASYTIATVLRDVFIGDLVVRNSASSAIKWQYVDESYMFNINCQSSQIGVETNTCSQLQISYCDFTANYVHMSMTNTHFVSNNASGFVDALNGSGVVLDTVSNSAFSQMFVLNSTADGLNVTSCTNSRIDGVFAENAGSGVEFVSGNNNVVFAQARVENNGSDGVKLTATSDNIFITNAFIKGNTGYGVNIAAASCDNTVITSNNFSSNTTSACNDSGTGTVIRGNVGLADNSTGGLVQDIQTFSTGGATSWTKPSGAKMVEVYVIGAGGGGGSGRRQAANFSISGGAGGGGGSIAYKKFNGSALGTSEDITVGTGGTGGVARTGSDQDGAAGGNGTATTFGTTTLLKANGGTGGPGGSTVAPTGGAGGATANGEIMQAGGNGGNGRTDDANGNTGDDSATLFSPRGGGAGGGFNATNTAKNGGVGGAFITNYVKAGGAVGTIGNSSIGLFTGGTGGGGGNAGSPGVTGGNGIEGSGGGGGGASGGTSGAGGNGGDGVVIVITSI